LDKLLLFTLVFSSSYSEHDHHLISIRMEAGLMNESYLIFCKVEAGLMKRI